MSARAACNCVGLTVFLDVLLLLQLPAAAQELKTVSPADVQNRIAQVRSSTRNTVDPQALELGRGLIKSGRFAEAAALFDVLVEKQPRDYTVLYFAALATFNAGRPSQAEPLARRALDAAVGEHKQSASDALIEGSTAFLNQEHADT